MRIYLAHHGQSQANVARVMDNRPAGPSLTELGIEQARKCLEWGGVMKSKN
jgi:broad specificity phosphatase PhoE